MEIEVFNDLISQGIALMTEEKYEIARETFKRAVEINAKSFEAHIHLGNAYANLGQFDEAILAFKRALIIDSSSGEALFAIGNLYLLKEDRIKAIDYFNKAEESGYRTPDLYQIMAGVFLDANDVPQALRCITRAIAVAPFDGELRLLKVRMYLSENRFNEALETLDEFQKVLRDAFEVYDLKSQIYCGLKRYDEALSICEDGIERFPLDARLALVKLKVLIEMEKYEDAEVLVAYMKENGQYKQVIKEASIQEIIIDLKKNNIDHAIEVLSNANKVLENDADITYLLLDIYGKTEKYEELLETSALLVEMDAGDFYTATAKYFHAHALDKVGRIEEAKDEYRELTVVLRKFTISTPSFYEGYIYRLLCHTRIGEYDKAFELADYLENMYPERADSHTFRSFIYKEKGDMGNYENEKNLAQKINPNLNI